MTPNLASLYLTHVAATYEKQRHLNELVGELSWKLDDVRQKIYFGNVAEWDVRFLGSQSNVSDTWLWGWANKHYSEAETTAARAVLDYGAQHNIEELTTRQLPIATLDGHQACIVACGILGAKAYYRAPFDAGASFYLITDSQFPELGATLEPKAGAGVLAGVLNLFQRSSKGEARKGSGLPESLRLATVFPQTISVYPVSNHRLAFEAYVDFLKLERKADGPKVVVLQGGRPVAQAEFDGLHRLAKLTSS